MITVAHQVSSVNGISNTGKSVFNDHIVRIGPSIITATASSTGKIIAFIQTP